MNYEAFSYHWIGSKHQYVFETLEEIVDYYWIQFACNTLNPEFRVLDTYDRQRIDLARLWEIYYRKRRENFHRYYQRKVGTYEFRNGPVPGIRSHRRWGGDRHPRTLQERRETKALHNDEDLVDLTIKIRARREKLPTSWDDIPRGDYSHRTWKRHRKTQYKAD